MTPKTPKGSSPSRLLRRVGLFALLLSALTLPSCNEQIRAKLQAEIDRYFTQPAARAELETKLEGLLNTKLEESLGGKELEVTGPNPYVHDIDGVSVALGSVPPKVTVPGQVEIAQTGASYYGTFHWKLDWAKGNGARVDIAIDLRSDDWFLFYEYPDHTVHIRNIALVGTGTAFVVVPKDGSKGTATITISTASLDLTALAEGWFWTVDVSGRIRRELREQLIRQLVGKAIEASFNAKL